MLLWRHGQERLLQAGLIATLLYELQLLQVMLGYLVCLRGHIATVLEQMRGCRVKPDAILLVLLEDRNTLLFVFVCLKKQLIRIILISAAIIAVTNLIFLLLASVQILV